MTLSHSVQRRAFNIIVKNLLKKNRDERQQAVLALIDLAEKFLGKSISSDSYLKVRTSVLEPENRWWRYINRILDETDPHVSETLLLNLGYESFLAGTKEIRQNREQYNCSIPWLILFDPTSACNMHCKGCWSGNYGNHYDLSFEDMVKIVTEGKELGIHLYMMTGGEPLVRKKDILKLAEKHSDAEFAFYTNSTLIDRPFCEELLRLGNLLPLLSIEGTEETNDSRRGAGHYNSVIKAMELLHEYGIVFGTSVCYTSVNSEAVTSDEFIQMLSDKGARFGFYFHYMPIGKNAVTDLLPTPEQRKYMIDRIRYIRSDRCGLDFFPMDFQNDGEYVGGCIAGGRNYFHINSAGDAEPCVFVHYSDSNIHDKSILEILKSPLFMAFHKGQPFNRNHLRPCPMLENPDCIRHLIKDTGATSTDLEGPESVEDLTAKCNHYSKMWGSEADKIWKEQKHKQPLYQNYSTENRY